jgi:putative photosynthetic complex assembly protein
MNSSAATKPSQKAPRPFPLFPLLSAGSLVLISLVSVAWVRWFAEPGAEAQPSFQVVMSRDLRFDDLPDGSVGVYDAGSDVLIQRLASGEYNFVRATLRGLARTRRALGTGAEIPFRLEQRTTGQLILIDPVTGQEVDLWAFGESNARGFEMLMEARPESPEAGNSFSATEPGAAGALQDNVRSLEHE